MSMNSLIITGDLSIVSSFSSVSSSASFNLDVSSIFKKADGSSFKESSSFPVFCFNSLAESLSNKFSNSNVSFPVRIVGCIKNNKFTNSTGKVCSSFSIIAEHIEFIKE